MSPAAVLVVDDDAALLDALSGAIALRVSDVTVETAGTAQRALELAAANDYDAIVTDVKMPGMDGLALLAELRKLRPDTPALLITGHGAYDLTLEALRGGAYDFIQKPIDRNYFFASLTRAIEARRLARQVAEQRLALERHVRVLEHVGDGVFLVDGAGRIRFWNSAAAALTRLDACDVVGRPAVEVLADWDALSRRIPVATAPGAETSRPATVPVVVAGCELWLSVAGVTFADGTVYTFRDLTAEHALADLQDEFVATVSHELRTPVTAIYGAAKTLTGRDGELGPEVRQRLLEVIAGESDRLIRVANEILLAGQLDAGRVQVTARSFDAVELGRDVLEAIQVYAPDTVRLSLVAPPALPPATADPEKLQQALVNLLDNAIKYSPDGGPVELAIEAGDTRLRFSVRDEGLGIAPEEQERIFDKFYRVAPSLTRSVGGTGLGLYVTRELVRRMDGRIAVTSEPGAGSTFVIELPLLV